MKSERELPYSYKEASTFGNGFPDRGVKCYSCNTLIPQLQELTDKNIEEWKNILKSKGHEEADNYLVNITGCNYRWAKIWRLHPNGPKAKTKEEAMFSENTKCPFCGKSLRTINAKQCPHCFKSWQNEST